MSARWQDGRRAGVKLAAGSIASLMLLTSVTASAQSGKATAKAKLIARGQYLVTIMDCGGCHTGGALAGKPDPNRRLAGSEIGFEIPGIGVVYPKNLSPDPDTGLGKWTDPEIVRAIRGGQGRDGQPLAPIMPWPSYSILSDADVQAIVAYLRSVPPVRFEAPRNAKPGEKATAPYLSVVAPK